MKDNFFLFWRWWLSWRGVIGFEVADWPTIAGRKYKRMQVENTRVFR
jgi:Trk-type K+ transport system membrane component